MDDKTITSVMEEDRKFEPSREFRERARLKSYEEYERIYKESIDDPVKFWEKVAKQEIHWFSPWKNAFSWDKEKVLIKWFEGGKLNVYASSH